MRTIAFLAILLFVTAEPERAAAGQDDGIVTFHLSFPEANHNDRVYRPPDAITVRFDIRNETSATALTLDAARLRSVVRPVVDGVRDVVVAWEGYPESSIDGMSAEGSMALAPGESLSWKVTLARMDGRAFDGRSYLVSFPVSDMLSALRDSTGAQWRGRIITYNGTVFRRLAVEPPESPEELRASLLLDASVAIRRKDLESALSAYKQAAALEPGSAVILSRVALTLLTLRRYDEAAEAYERLVALNGLDSVQTARDLARAYVGLRNEADARRVLIQGGVSADRIEAELSELRSRVALAR